MATKISNFFNYQNNNSKLEILRFEHMNMESQFQLLPSANLYNIKRDDVVLFYFKKGASYASVYTQSKTFSRKY